MTRPPKIPIPIEPKLIDIPLLELQAILASRLQWLDRSYGKAQKLIEKKEKVLRYYPGVYTGSQEYLKTFPDEHIGNFSFFIVEDGESYGTQTIRKAQIQVNAGLIFWFDFRKVFPDDWQNRTVENVKELVLQAFTLSKPLKSQIRIGKIFEQAENIYKGFSHREIESQFLMRPYGGFRIDMTIKFSRRLRCSVAELEGLGAMEMHNDFCIPEPLSS